MKRALWIFLEFCAGLFASLAFLYGAAVLRLASGPVPLDSIAPYLGSALSNPQSGVSVVIDHALLTLGKNARIELLARGVRVSAGQGGAIALPELSVDLSLRAALHGVIAPSRIVLERPSLRLARDRDGTFHLGFDGSAAAGSDVTVAQVLHDLSGPIDARAPISALTELAIRRAEFLVDDEALSVSWRAHDADLILDRDASGLRGSVSLATAGGRINGVVAYLRAEDRVEAQLGVSDLEPASWAAAAPALAPLALLDLPLSGTVRATLDPSRLAILAASCDLRLGAGTLRHEQLPGGAVAIAGGEIRASYDPTGGRVVIEHATLDLNGPSASASGTIDGVGGGLLAGAWPRTAEALFDLDLRDVTVASLPRLWPEQVSSHARQWVLANVRGGVADRASFRLGLHIDLDAPDTLTPSSISGSFVFRGADVAYFDTMPPAHDVAGSATFDTHAVKIALANAAVLGMRARDSQVVIGDLDAPDARLSLALSVNGPLHDAAAVLDAEPLHALRSVGLARDGLAGTFDGRIEVAFPLVKQIHLRQVSYSADLALAGVAAPHIALGKDLRDGALRLRIDHSMLRIDGTAALAGVPVGLALQRSVAADASPDLRVSAAARLDADARRAFGFDFPAYVSGPVGVDLVYDTVGDGGRAQVALDLTDSGLEIAPLGWHKPAGMPATARFGLNLAGDRIAAIQDASVSGGGLEAQLGVTFQPDGIGLARVELAHLAVGETDASGSAVRSADGGWRITLGGHSFDATALRHDYRRFTSGGAGAAPLEIDATLDRLVLGAGRAATDVRARLISDGAHWQTASADVTLAGGVPARLRYGAVAGAQRFDMQADDLGALLRLFDLSDDVQGGRIQLAGTAIDEGSHRSLKLKARGTDYRVVNAPVFAQLLSLASLSGINALMVGEGIPFSRFEADIVFDDDRIAFDNLRAYGGAIGISANGTIDRAADTLDLSGTLVPAYMLNSVLGNIPIIGSLLMGGEGEGIFGANFRIAGPVDAPRISVNPLSALAPGFLRKLFLFAPGNPAREAASPPADVAK